MFDSHATEETQILREEIVALLPALRAFAFGLTRQRPDADDLVQDTLVRAIQSLHQYTPGTRLKSWLFTIMRNAHRNAFNIARRETTSDYDVLVMKLRTQPAQEAAAAMTDFRALLARLPQEQQEVLILIGGLGFSYEDTAEVLGCAVGTVKSRLSRGRERLGELMEGTVPQPPASSSGRGALAEPIGHHELPG
jgi:RNA polymerase sigma-70 factor (ECF subfamily)